MVAPGVWPAGECLEIELLFPQVSQSHSSVGLSQGRTGVLPHQSPTQAVGGGSAPLAVAAAPHLFGIPKQT